MIPGRHIRIPDGVVNKKVAAMAEVLGQRGLLCFGVLLAWLMLFHLLVNIWLLCVFTSLLVVLGGWLGSQAVLESNSLVHLERFITIKQISSSLEDEEQLDQEIQNTVMKIIRDFVSSWYSTISTERAFEMDVQEAMISMAMELKTRAKWVDRKTLTQRLLHLYGGHLHNYLKAKELLTEREPFLPPAEKPSVASDRLWQVYSELCTPHPVVKSPAVELNYTRAVVDLLLHALVPPVHLESRTGRFIVGELTTCNVLLPFFTKLSDPDWLNVLLVQVFTTKPDPQQETSVAAKPVAPSVQFPPATPPSELAPPGEETNHGHPKQTKVVSPSSPTSEVDTEVASETDTDTNTDKLDLIAYDSMDSGLYCPQNNMEEEESAHPFLTRYLRPSKSNPFYQENDSDLDSPLSDYKRGSLDSLVMVGQESDVRRECATPTESAFHLEEVYPGLVDESCPKVLVNSRPLDKHDGCCPSSLRTAEGTPGFDGLCEPEDKQGSPASTHPARELLLGLEQTGGAGTPTELRTASPSQVSSTPLPSFSFEPLSSPEGPVLIQNLRITGTITAKEHRGTGSHPYTLYTIKYETVVGCETPGCVQQGSEDTEAAQPDGESPAGLQPLAYHMVNRRYSEFLNLQTRLEEKNELRKLIKGVKGPKKIFPDMPFGNMDSDKIEARKGLLETFLKHLCFIPEVANSEEMQEFLALNTDARIAFVKKPFIVSRIDKIVVNAIVDTLKTAFPRSEPQSPTEDNEGEMDCGKMTSDRKNKGRLRFSSKNSPYDLKPQMICWDQCSTLFNGMSLVGLEAFISGQETLISRGKACDPELEHRGLVRQAQTCGRSDSSSIPKWRDNPASEMALAEPALNILCLLMMNQWSWLCTENIQRTIRMLFGTLIDRWLEVSVTNLTCVQYWVAYLRVIQEALWPGGVLPAQPWPQRSQQQKNHSKEEALQHLMRVVPDLVSDLLGSDKYRLSWQTALDSLQDQYINRHLVYCLCDLLLEHLVPEIPEEDFQRRLLQSLSKNTERPGV